MEQIKKTSCLQNGLVWFGAGVSIAEIITGTYFAELGFKTGLTAILVGHLIGGVLFFLAGLIGAVTKKSSMQTCSISFGRMGAVFFAILNIVQLVGWTSIMIYDGASITKEISSINHLVWCVIIGLLIFLWIFFGVKDLGVINKIAMGLLFCLTVVLCVVIFRNKITHTVNISTMTFAGAVELAVAMPLSWLPLISDYTREAQKPIKATVVSTITYSVVSIWMYVIGMSASIFTNDANIASIMVKAGLGIVALIILVLSTVTTTFLDAWSAGISSEVITKKVNGKTIALITTVVGTVLAMIFNMDNITNFLYFIGSVFAPMIAILISDYFILKVDNTDKTVDIASIVLWIVGFGLYRYFMTVDFVLGPTFLCMIVVSLITIIVRKCMKKMRRAGK